MKHSLITGLTALAAAGSVLAAPAAADVLSDKYAGKTITIIYGYGAGGTYGKTSILLSRYLGDHIPGNPTVITKSMPGAGGMKSANYAFNAMPKGGLYMLMPPDMSMVSQVLRPKKVKYDARKFTWLGRVFGSNNLIATRRDAGATNYKDAMKNEIIMGSTGKGSPTFIVTSLANGLLGTKFKIVSGYKGSARVRQAMEQGEVKGVSLAWAAWKNGHPQWFQGSESFAIGLLQSGFKRSPDLPNVPLIGELAQGANAKAAADLIATSSLIGRGLVMPPGTPKELIEPLRAAFWKTVNSPEFKAEAKKSKLPLSQLRGAEIQKTVNEILNMSPVAIETAQKAIFGKK
ncbi:MAG: tripartite-type tricarboxylate transporter receptor subunit TctC [Paracoccaceae bacterium]|jgi:tripartite-type tricarboxylate transporter receptor subunit TctC